MPEDTMTFEDRLLAQLRDELPPPRPRWLRTGVIAAAACAVAAILALGQPAYAIRSQPDGSLTVTMNSTEPGDVAAAETELKSRGVRIELIASTHDCLGVLGAPLVTPSHAPLTGPPSLDQLPELYAFVPEGDGRFLVRPEAIPAGQVLWVAIADGRGSLVSVAQFAPAGAPQPRVCA